MEGAFTLRQLIQRVHAHVHAGNLSDAESLCRQILSLYPDQLETLVNLSVILLRQDKADEALATADRAVSLSPNSPEAHHTRGNILIRLGRYDEAITAYDQAISFRPDRATFHSNRGSALQFIGRLDDAIAALDRAIALQPGLEAAQANRLFALHFHPAYGPQDLMSELRQWGERIERGQSQELQSYNNDRSPRRRLRVGYVSPHFRDHCLGRLMLPIVREHDRDATELYFYCDVVTPGSVTEHFRHEADTWHNTSSLSHDELAQRVRADAIDVLVDLTLHMAGSRLPAFARKPAPIQVTYGGYPSGTGLQAMDYRLTDPYLDPPGDSDAAYIEKPIRLPNCFWCYASDGPHPGVNTLPFEEAGFITFGCLNNFIKVNDGVLHLWANVLANVDRSRLLLLAPEGSARQRTLDVLQANGVAPTRVEFVSHQPRDAYLKTYRRIDIGLDTFPYNGHTTSLDAFWMGVPVVTLVGQTAVGRAGWSQLSNLGLTELAARNETQFVEIATRLAASPTRLRGLRQNLRPRMTQSPLTDPRRFARNLEAAYRNMWSHWCEPSPDGSRH